MGGTGASGASRSMPRPRARLSRGMVFGRPHRRRLLLVGYGQRGRQWHDACRRRRDVVVAGAIDPDPLAHDAAERSGLTPGRRSKRASARRRRGCDRRLASLGAFWPDARLLAPRNPRARRKAVLPVARRRCARCLGVGPARDPGRGWPELPLPPARARRPEGPRGGRRQAAQRDDRLHAPGSRRRCPTWRRSSMERSGTSVFTTSMRSESASAQRRRRSR